MAHINHVRRNGDRVGSQQEDYCSSITRLEKKTNMMDGPHSGNMQHAFKRVEVDEGFETAGPFGRTKHMGQDENKGRHNKQNTCEEAETRTVTGTGKGTGVVEYFERKKQDFLVTSK